MVRKTAREAVAEFLHDEMTIAVGGFGLCGVPTELIEAVRDSGARRLTIVSNNMGVDGKGLGLLLENGQVRKVIASYVGENALFARQYLDGQLDVEFNPQGTLAERMRAGGAGIPAFYTRTGVGTAVAEGKVTTSFGGEDFLLEEAIVADLSLVKAHAGDRRGNLQYRLTARNFNPVVAACGAVTVAEVDHLVPTIDADHIHTPGIYVHRLVVSASSVKDIEKVTTRPRTPTIGFPTPDQWREAALSRFEEASS